MLRGLVITLVGILLMATAITGFTSESPSDEYRFRVYLDDREIGYHDFLFSDSEQGRTLESEAEFRVKILFITAFRYEHKNMERWRDGCLTEIESRTSSNGKEFSVDGRLNDERLLVESQNGAAPLSGCVKTFAYWDKDFLNADKLLNSQTGEYLDIEVTPLGEEQFDYQGNRITVERYRLSAKDVDVEISYALETGEWIGLDSTIKGGRKLRYRRPIEAV